MLKFLLVVLVIALVVYACVTLLDRRMSGPRKPRGGAPRRGPQRPLGPDDDPDFLRDLNRRRPPKPKPKGPKGDE